MPADLERLVGDRADAHAAQAHHRVADRVAHVAHLAGAPLVQGDRHEGLVLPRAETRVEQAHDGGRRAPPRDGHAPPEPSQRVFVGHAPHARVILPLDLVLRVQEALHEPAVVREEQQAFRVVVETADRVDVLPHVRQQVEHRRPPLGILPRRHIPAGLVEQDVSVALRDVDALAIDSDVVSTRIGLRAELEHRGAVD